MGAMVNYGPIFLKFGTIIYVHIKLICVEYDTNIWMGFMPVKVIFWKGIYMGAMVNYGPIFLKIDTLI